MKPDTKALQIEAQQVLDELISYDVIPFKLTAREVESLGQGEYIVRFHDSRLHSVDLSWRSEQSFKALFRAALIDRLSRLSGAPTKFRDTSAFHS